LYEIVLTKAALFSPENGHSVIDISKSWQPDTSYDKLPRIKVKEEYFGSIAKNFIKSFKERIWSLSERLDEDMKMMTVVHPIAAGLGME
jgi:hypothetical protein